MHKNTHRWFILVALFPGGCSDSGDEMVPLESQAIAMVQQASSGELRIAVTSRDHAPELSAVFTDTPPTSFRWISTSVGAAKAGLVYSPQGYTADLGVAAAALTVRQTFTDACNPSLDDYSVCWFVENLAAGSDGVSGTVSLHGDPSTVAASINIMFEGQSTRHGYPEYFKHQTVSSFTASIVSGGAQ